MAPIDLQRAECLRLLAGAVVGRVVHTESALPAAHPVAYLLDGEEVVFLTAWPSTLAAARSGQVVAFEADDFSAATRTGWSTVGIGIAYEVTDPVRLADLGPRIPPAWDDGHQACMIAVPLQRLTGRRVGPVDDRR